MFVVGVPADGLVTPLEHARDRLAETHQTWLREPETGLWRLDLFREPGDETTWVCRRDERIRLPYDEVIAWTDDGIPYGRPEVVLLYKAKHVEREKDQADFEAALPHLEPESESAPGRVARARPPRPRLDRAAALGMRHQAPAEPRCRRPAAPTDASAAG